MESTGTIVFIAEPMKGTSERTGNGWMAQSFVIEVSSGEHGQYKKRQVFELFGEDKIKEAQLYVGKEVRVLFDLEAHEHNGRWYNNTRAWKVEQTGQQGQQAAPQPQYGGAPFPQQGYAPQPQGYYPQQPAMQPQGGYYPQGGYQQPQAQKGDLPF